MKKTLVCIVNDEVVRNYLFVVEMFREGDEVMLVSAHRMKEDAKRLEKALPVPPESVSHIVLRHDYDEEVWDVMCRTLREGLSQEGRYCVNLSGGTRFMALAVQTVFSEFHSLFFFVPPTRNLVIHSMIDGNNDNNDDTLAPIGHRMSVEEYLGIHGLKTTVKHLTQSAEYTNHFFSLFVGGYFSDNDFAVLDLMRSYRNTDRLDIAKVEHLPKSTERRPRVPHLAQLLRFVHFPCQKEGYLNKDEIQYITGGWFEEYVYRKIKDDINPDDIQLGVCVQRPGSSISNDLDVAFTLGNKLFVAECKTGVKGTSLFHQIVYKASALHEALLGTSSNSAICSLSSDYGDQLTSMALGMDIYYCDRDYFTNPKQWQKYVDKVLKRANG